MDFLEAMTPSVVTALEAHEKVEAAPQHDQKQNSTKDHKDVEKCEVDFFVKHWET